MKHNRKLRQGQTVKIMTGKHRGTTGIILRMLNKQEKVLVDACKLAKRGKLSQTKQFFEPISVSNIAIIESTNERKEN